MSDSPPYLAIAATLRQQIAGGELGPGDRVPSTRQLALQWGVAMATAAKALTVLRNEGVVESRPRSATVVATVTGSPSPAATTNPAAEPNRDRILGAAIELADAEGLAALSMRAIATRLNVTPMTIYRYVRDKDDLLALMSDAAFAGADWPTDQPADPRAQLELAARHLWEIHKRHPWLAHVTSLSRPLALPNLLPYSELVLTAMPDGVDPIAAFDLNVLLFNYVTGIAANLAQAARAAADSGVSDEQWIRARQPEIDALVRTGRYPTWAAAVTEMRERGGYDLDLDRLFELGLRLLLDGIVGPAAK